MSPNVCSQIGRSVYASAAHRPQCACVYRKSAPCTLWHRLTYESNVGNSPSMLIARPLCSQRDCIQQVQTSTGVQAHAGRPLCSEATRQCHAQLSRQLQASRLQAVTSGCAGRGAKSELISYQSYLCSRLPHCRESRLRVLHSKHHPACTDQHMQSCSSLLHTCFVLATEHGSCAPAPHPIHRPCTQHPHPMRLWWAITGATPRLPHHVPSQGAQIE